MATTQNLQKTPHGGIGDSLKKKRQLNLIEFIVQIVTLVSFIVIPSATMYSGSISSTSDSITHTTSTTTTSMGGYLLLNAPVFLFLILGFMAVNAIICLVSVLGNSTDRDGKAHVAFAIVAGFLCFWSLITDFTSSPVHLEISVLYKAFAILCSIAIVVIAVIKRSSRIVPAVEKSATTIIQAASSADELKKYKELLDSGVITQEEFDAKKKQLMGL